MLNQRDLSFYTYRVFITIDVINYDSRCAEVLRKSRGLHYTVVGIFFLFSYNIILDTKPTHTMLYGYKVIRQARSVPFFPLRMNVLSIVMIFVIVKYTERPYFQMFEIFATKYLGT